MHRRYGPYFTDAYRTPWGDGAQRRRGRQRPRPAHVHRERHAAGSPTSTSTGCALDAIDADPRPDGRAVPRGADRAVHAAGRARRAHGARRSPRAAANNPRTFGRCRAGGIGSDAAWDDDVHHALRVALTGDRRGYYVDYDGVADLADGARAPLGVRRPLLGRTAGARTAGRPTTSTARPLRRVQRPTMTTSATRRPAPGRRSTTASGSSPRPPCCCRRSRRCCSWARSTASRRPFPFFVDHGDPELLEAVREGRADEFARRVDREPSPIRPTRRRSPTPCSTRPWRPRARTARCSPPTPSCSSLRRLHGVLHDPDARAAASSAPATRSSSTAASATPGRCSSSTSAMAPST